MSMQQQILVAYLIEALDYLDHTNLTAEEWSRYYYRVLRTASRRVEDMEDESVGL